MAVGTGVVILDKDGQRVVELDSRSSIPVVVQPEVSETIVTSGDNVGSAQTGKVVWTPLSGKRIHLFGIMLSTDTAGAIKFNMGASTIIPNTYLPINGNVTIGLGSKELWVAPTGDARLEYTSTIAGNHSVSVMGIEI